MFAYLPMGLNMKGGDNQTAKPLEGQELLIYCGTYFSSLCLLRWQLASLSEGAIISD